MFQNRRLDNLNLDEDFLAVGIPTSGDEISRMATRDMDECISIAGLGQVFGGERSRLSLLEDSNASQGKGGADDVIDGRYVTRELLKRMVDLPYDHMEEEDYDELISAFECKEIPDGDDELLSMCESMVQALHERRVMRRMRAGKMISTKRTDQRTKIKDRIRKRKPKSKRLGKKLAKREATGRIDPAKVKTARRQGMTKREIIKTAKDKIKNMRSGGRSQREDEGLAGELRSMLDEHVSGSLPYADVRERIFNIFEMIAELSEDEDVSEVLQETWDNFDDSIVEGMDDDSLLDAIRPSLRVIKHCLTVIDGDQGNG